MNQVCFWLSLCMYVHAVALALVAAILRPRRNPYYDFVRFQTKWAPVLNRLRLETNYELMIWSLSYAHFHGDSQTPSFILNVISNWSLILFYSFDWADKWLAELVKLNFHFAILSVSDTNECEKFTFNEENQKMGVCATKAECTNTVGSYMCKCLDGYRGNGKECTSRWKWCLGFLSFLNLFLRIPASFGLTSSYCIEMS